LDKISRTRSGWISMAGKIIRGDKESAAAARDRPMLSRWSGRKFMKKFYLFALVILSLHALAGKRHGE
jgi:hypothetical protein